MQKSFSLSNKYEARSQVFPHCMILFTYALGFSIWNSTRARKEWLTYKARQWLDLGPIKTEGYSVCSLVVPTLEEAILTSVLKKNFKWPSILGQEGHSYSPKHSNLSYDQFGGGLEQSDTAPLLLPPGWRDTDSFSWICSVFNSSISRRSWNLFLCPCKWALRLKERWLNRWTWTTKRRTRPPTRWWTTCLQAR